MSQKATIQYTGTNITKDEFLKQLGLFTQIIQLCPDNMIFRVEIEADPIDQRFDKIADIVLKSNQEAEKVEQEQHGFSEKDLERITQGLQAFKDKRNEDEN